ncbi:amidohydrolase 2 [Hysterangium stoloniferum]|nr:amidohydrolase 2 [Hysterangium stoloniferum]
MHHFVYFLFALASSCFARRWNDTGKGAIIFEEAWTIPELIGQIRRAWTLYMVLSCAQPCIQGISDPVVAASMAVKVNNDLAAAIANNTMRFGGFAALSMHNASTAAQELKRAVQELGFFGALLNDYQQSGPDNGKSPYYIVCSVLDFFHTATLLYYDQPEYDVFWEMVTELDVPVYLHPRGGIAQLTALQYQHAIWLNGAAQQFASTLSNHVLGLCTNGIFDRFPLVKVIIGHLGERIPSDLHRIDEQLLRQISRGMPMRRNVTSYWGTNLFETTSGNFATPLLKFHIDQIGLDRILYSIDYPYVNMTEGANWVDTLPLKHEDLLQLKRGAAIKLLGLNK